MAFLIGGANTLDTGAYEVANSCRINDDDSAYMTVTPGSNSADRTALTISTWVKRGKRGAINTIFDTTTTDSGYINFVFNAADQIDFAIQNTDYASAPTTGFKERKKTNRLFRDCSAWYHIVIEVDTTESTETDRLKIWVNGTRETSWNHETNNTDQNQVLPVHVGSTSHAFNVGRQGNNTYFFDGYLAEFCYIDGTAYTPTSFGEFDEDSPTIWKPIDVSGLTFGTNGFYLDFEASGNLGNDVNGGTDLTETNIVAADQATDTPTNSFCTLNPLNKWYVASTLSEGNCNAVGGSGWGGAKGTMAVSTGKWYWEVKLSGTMANHHSGVQEINVEGAAAANPQNLTGTTVHYNHDGGEIKTDGTATTADYGVLDDGDILGVALDMTAGSYGQITFYDQNSAIASDINLAASSDYVMPFSTPNSSTVSYNFGGCSSFALSSAESDENGYGNFEFAPPSGYLALCTKNLATDG